MYNFDPYNVLLAIATNIPVLLMTAFVLQGHICLKVTLAKWLFILILKQSSIIKHAVICTLILLKRQCTQK